MFNTSTIDSISKEYVEQINNIFADKLKKIILYGSYARGDFNEFSDIDVMILVDMPDEEIKKKFDDVVDVKCGLDNKYDVFMSSIVKDMNHFNKLLSIVPFYQNINNEGVVWYGNWKQGRLC